MRGADRRGFFAATQQIAGGFFLLAGNVDGGQRPGAVQHGELAGVAAIGFDPLSVWRHDTGPADDGAVSSVIERQAARSPIFQLIPASRG